VTDATSGSLRIMSTCGSSARPRASIMDSMPLPSLDESELEWDYL
jgi:hypothetical protein